MATNFRLQKSLGIVRIFTVYLVYIHIVLFTCNAFSASDFINLLPQDFIQKSVIAFVLLDFYTFLSVLFIDWNQLFRNENQLSNEITTLSFPSLLDMFEVGKAFYFIEEKHFNNYCECFMLGFCNLTGLFILLDEVR